MKVTINNKETETQAKTIRELAQELDLPDRKSTRLNSSHTS